MRALEISAPWGIDAIKIVERPKPEPGPGEVLLRMRAATLNYRDLMIVENRYPLAPAPGAAFTPLSDGCGVVEAIGEGVTRVAVGDRVAPMFFQKWLSGRASAEALATSLGSPIEGVARECAVYHEDGVSKVPAFLSDAQVASLPCAGLTAWKAMFADANLQAGASVLLLGTGGVSIFGLQFARAAGIKTIITSSSDAKLTRAKALGADHVLNYKTTPDWGERARALTGGAGVDFVMEVGGAATMPQSLKAVRQGGHMAMIGVVGGQAEPPPQELIDASGARLQRVFVGAREHFEAMCVLIEQHKIAPVVDKVFPFSDAPEAFRAMKGETHFGKIAISF